MKKILTTLSMILVAFTAMVFTSCEAEDAPERTQVVQFYCAPNSDLSSVCDLEVVYTNEQGSTVTEPLNNAFSKRLSINKFPMSGSFKIHATKKSTLPDQYTFSLKLDCRYTHGISQDNTPVWGVVMSRSQLDDFIEKINNKSWNWEFSNDGTSMR